MNPTLKPGFHVQCEILTEHRHKVCGFVNRHNVPYATRDEAQGAIDALKIKREDLRDNSDITRLKGVTEKDIRRMEKYQRSFMRVEQFIKELEK